MRDSGGYQLRTVQPDLAAQVASVMRRLFATLAFAAALFGVMQPALACVRADCATDCCGTGSPAACTDQAGFAATRIEPKGCCSARPAVTSSASVASRARQHAGHASGSLSPTMPPAFWTVRLPLAASTTLPQPRIARDRDESAIYLLTARLRL